jgi:hypothetical protein
VNTRLAVDAFEVIVDGSGGNTRLAQTRPSNPSRFGTLPCQIASVWRTGSVVGLVNCGRVRSLDARGAVGDASRGWVLSRAAARNSSALPR